MNFEQMHRARQAQLQEDGEALHVPTTAETQMRAAPTLVVDNAEPEKIGAPSPGAMGVLAFVAMVVSGLLLVCRLAGAPIGAVWIFAPIWGSALAISLVAAGASAVAWARRDA